MTLLDRVVTSISPVAGMRRVAARKAMQVMNTGYSEGGAATNRNWARGWRWRGGSVREDVNVNLSTLRQRSRDLFMNSPIAAAALTRRVVNVIGPGLRMRATPDAEVLGLSPDEATAWARVREREFALWARSRECETSGLDNFDELQALAYLSWILNGDCIALLTMAEGIDQPYDLRVQLIEADRISTPPGKQNDERFHEGVETDADGRVVAYHIRSNHPLASSGLGSSKTTWTRVPVRGEQTGRLNVLHLIARQRTGQYRGVPILAPVIAECKNLSRYADAELQAAVIAAFIAVLVKSKTPDTAIGEAFADGIATGVSTSDGTVNANEPFELPMGSASMIAMNPGEDAEVVDPKRPNGQFGTFIESVSTEIGAATDIPVELLRLKFTSSYTAARAALLEFWKRVRLDKSAFAADFCDPISQEILEQGLLLGRIEAGGYWDDPAVRAGWLACGWHGQAMGQMNPDVEARAARSRVDSGFSTFAREAMEISGMDFDDIVQEQTVERQRLKEAGVLQEATSGPNGQGT